MNSSHTKKVALFRNPLLSLLSQTNRGITTSYILLYAGMCWLIYYQFNSVLPIAYLVLFAFLGLLSWTLFEYILHRYLFHLHGNSAIVKRFTFVMHGVHHEHPKEEKWVFMPPAPGTLFILVFASFFYLLMGKEGIVFLSGFLIGYLIYSTIHYYIHLKRPSKRFAFFWRHHSLHHYKYPDKAFGVSSPLWDVVFRTMPPGRKLRVES